MTGKSPAKSCGSEEEQAKRAKILEIQRDSTLTEAEKSQRIQALHGSKWLSNAMVPKDPLDGLSQEEKDSITCGICMDIVARPVTLPCQHNMCLGCLKGIRKMDANMRKCPYCRKELSTGFIDNARINMAMVAFVRARKAQCAGKTTAVAAVVHVPREEEERPEEAFLTARAVRKGMANAASGSLKMTCRPDHFGPIGPEFDPKGNRGVVVGDMYPNRMACRMWNVHLPHVAGIAGQGNTGAQSVVLSGGYVDDVDEGEYFLYTGSGGKDLSGNKRNGAHDKDQEFTRYNLALKASCEKGLPVRVVRSHKEKRSAYAPKLESIEEMEEAAAGGKAGRARKPAATDGKGAAGEDGSEEGDEEEDGDGDKEADEESGSEEGGSGSEAEGGEGEDGEEEAEGGKAGGSIRLAKAIAHNPVRYDGIYRVLACWRTKGEANYLVCRYLFVRCDNAPAPWSSEDCGDKPRMEIPERAAKEIAQAKKLGEEITYMTKTPFWDYDPVMEEWGWARPPPVGKAAGPQRGPKQEKPLEKQLETARREVKRLIKQLTDSYGCLLCHQVATRPVYTPCAHIYCMDCLKGKLDDGAGPARNNARPSRTSSQRKPCPTRGCGKDLTAFMKDAQVNITMAAQAAAASEGVKRKEAEVAALQRRLDGSEDPGSTEAAAPADGAGEGEPQAAPQPQSPNGGAGDDAGQLDGGAGAAADEKEEAKPEREPEAEAEADPPAEAEASPGADAPPPPAAVAATGGGGASRWRLEATCLAERYPEFDVALISGLLDDQGGDMREVDAYLKSIKRTQQKRKAPAAAGSEGVSKRSQKKGGARGRGSKAAAEAADPQQAAKEEQQEEEEEQEDDKAEENEQDSGAPEQGAVAGDGDDDAMEEAEAKVPAGETKGKGKGRGPAAGKAKGDKPVGKGKKGEALAAKDSDAQGKAPGAAKRRKVAA